MTTACRRTAILATMLLLCGNRVQAITRHVPAEYATVLAAMTAAVSGDSVLVAPGTYTNCNGGPCDAYVALMKGGVALLSEGGPDVTTLRVDTPGYGGITVVWASGIVTGGTLLKGFTITGTASGYRGAAFITCRDVVVEDCHFVDLAGGASDGAGLKANGTSITVRNCKFRNCVSTLEGGGFSAYGSPAHASLVVEGSLFENCSGGGAILVGESTTSAEVRECVFLNNTQNTALAVLQMPQAEVSRNVFQGNSSVINAAALTIGMGGTTSIRDNLFVGNDGSHFRSVLSWRSVGEIRGNTFYGNVAPPSGGVVFDFSDAGSGTSVVTSNNIFAGSSGGPAYRVQSTAPTTTCNLFWSNTGGNYLGYVPAPTDLFADPLFCDPVTRDLYLMTGSPCLPENSGVCGLIGAFGQGCGTVSVDAQSWGQIKAVYRGTAQ